MTKPNKFGDKNFENRLSTHHTTRAFAAPLGPVYCSNDLPVILLYCTPSNYLLTPPPVDSIIYIADI